MNYISTLCRSCLGTGYKYDHKSLCIKCKGNTHIIEKSKTIFNICIENKNDLFKTKKECKTYIESGQAEIDWKIRGLAYEKQ